MSFVDERVPLRLCPGRFVVVSPVDGIVQIVVERSEAPTVTLAGGVVDDRLLSTLTRGDALSEERLVGDSAAGVGLGREVEYVQLASGRGEQSG